MHEVPHNANSKRAMGAAIASDGERAPIASFWVRIMTSWFSIKKQKSWNKDHRFTWNLHGLMMMIVESIPWNISVWNAIFDEK